MRSVTLATVFSLLSVLAACQADDGLPAEEHTSSDQQPVLGVGEQAAWVVYRTSSGLDTTRSWNSTGGSIAVTNVPTGTFTVTLNNYTSADGNTQVTALATTTDGTGNTRCKTSNQTISSGALVITVLCHNGAGTAANSGFMLSYAHFVGGTSPNSRGAYVWMDKPTGGTLGTTRMWGDSFTVSWLSAGTYQLTFGAEDLSTGNFEVTASGTDQTYCKMASTPHSHTIDIKCYVSGGTLTNSKFFLRFTRATATCRGGIHDTEQGTGAYIYYNQTLTPPAGYTFNYWEDNYQCMCVHEDVNTVENKALGDVVVTYHSLGWPSHPEAAITTAKGSGSEYCMNLQIASDAGNTIVEVNCWNSSGTSHADSSFYQLLLSNPVPNCFAN